MLFVCFDDAKITQKKLPTKSLFAGSFQKLDIYDKNRLHLLTFGQYL
jgi:hypothetical protein